MGSGHDDFGTLKRRANERMADLLGARLGEAGIAPFLCECDDGECKASLPLSLGEFARVRLQSTRRRIVEGHPRPGSGRVVGGDGGVEVVETDG